MAKRCNPSLLDATLDVIKTGITGLGPADKIAVCSAEPTTYTEGHATYMLAEATGLTGTDWTIANGDGGGNTPRKITAAQQSSVLIGTSGTATHVAWLDSANSALLEVTTCTSQALTANGSNTVTIPAHKAEISAPT